MDEPLEEAGAQTADMRFRADDDWWKLLVVPNDRYVRGLNKGAWSDKVFGAVWPTHSLHQGH